MDEINATLLLELVEWSQPRRLDTRRGPRVFREGAPTPEFWEVWRLDKDAVKELGVNVSKNEETDEFEVQWWEDVEDDEQPPLAMQLQPVDGCIQRDDPLPAVLPLRHYQVRATWTLWHALTANPERFALDASETGLGKTFEALAVARLMGLNLGVVCPANVVTKWTNTAIDFFGLEPEFVLSYDKLRNGGTDYVTRGTRFTRGKDQPTLSWNLVDSVLLVFDEIHVCAGLGTLNSKLLRAALGNRLAYVLGLSATVANSPLDLSTIGVGLGLHRGDDWWDWCRSNGCNPGHFGGLTFNARSGTKAEAALHRLHHHIFPRRGCRVRRTDVADELPQNLVMAELVDLDEAGRGSDVQLALQSLDDKVAEDERKALEKETSVSGLTMNLRERQRSEILKAGFIADKAAHLMESGRSVIIFVNFTATVGLLVKSLNKVKHALLIGGSDRDVEILKFQANRVQLIICQTAAGAASIDLHDEFGSNPRATIISPTYSARLLLQALGRADRGQPTDVLQYVLFAAGGVEERACQAVQRKLNNLALLNDGDLAGAVQIV